MPSNAYTYIFIYLYGLPRKTPTPSIKYSIPIQLGRIESDKEAVEQLGGSRFKALLAGFSRSGGGDALKIGISILAEDDSPQTPTSLRAKVVARKLPVITIHIYRYMYIHKRSVDTRLCLRLRLRLRLRLCLSSLPFYINPASFLLLSSPRLIPCIFLRLSISLSPADLILKTTNCYIDT